MIIKESANQYLPKISPRDYPLKRSSSVNVLIHGDSSPTTNHYYVDSLERFKRDYATVDREERDKKRQKIQQNLKLRRNNSLQREISLRQIEEENINRLRQRQKNSLLLHKMGSKHTIHSLGVPINPISLNYQDTEKGKLHQEMDNDKGINKLVRAHHLTTCGSSGYNIINGQATAFVEKLVTQQNFPKFEDKLMRYYQKFRVGPNQK